MLSCLTTKLKLYSDEFKLKLKDSSFLLSFSGGMDSTLMASLLVEIRNEYNFKLGFVHINHHAHKESGKVETFVSQYSHENNVDYYLYELFFDLQNNFEACAREKRYTILAEIAKNNRYDFVLTAHHQDDQLETLYMKKIDGSDWISKIGIREKMGKLRRPFLYISKDAIKLHVKNNNIPWIEDPTNSDMSIRRNKIRQHELPQAFHANSGLKESLLKLADENVVKIKMTALKLKCDQGNVIKDHSLNSMRINRIVLQKYNIEELKLFTYSSIASLLKIKLNLQSGGLWNEFKKFISESSTGSIFHIGSLTFMINRDEIVAMNDYCKLKIPEIARLCNNLLWYSGKFKMINKTKAVLSSSKKYFSVTNSIYQDGLYIRRWKYGDRIISATSQKHVLLSDLYINNKLSKYDKLMQPVVVNANDRIFWIPGLLHGKINYNNIDKVKIIKWVQK